MLILQMQSVRCALQNNWNFRKINKEIVFQTKNRKNYKKIKKENNLDNILSYLISLFLMGIIRRLTTQYSSKRKSMILMNFIPFHSFLRSLSNVKTIFS